MPMTRRIPKRGFTNPFRVSYQVVGLADIAALTGDITTESLVAAGIVSKGRPAKVLANGELSGAVTVRGLKVSAAAKAKIEAAGGKVED